MAPQTPSKKTRSPRALNAANLEALGPERLAAILLAVADEQPTTKRRVRMELAAQVSADDLASEIEKHLDTVSAAHVKVHWRKLKALRQDLDLTKSMITVRLAEADPVMAVRLLLRFTRLERGVLARVRDIKGEVGQIFSDAVGDLARLAAAATAARSDLVAAIFDTLVDARVDARGKIALAVVPALAEDAIERLRARIETEMTPRRRINAGWRDALHVLLDAQGDAQGYAATFSVSERVLPPVGARIASRFLKTGQIEEAERALETSKPHVAMAAARPPSSGAPIADAGFLTWERVQIDLLDAKGEGATAQAARWAAFERDLSLIHLDAYLRRLSDFDDVVAKDRAIDYAKVFRPFSQALDFLIALPALTEAASLVLTRADEIDGLAIEIVEPAVRALEGRHPLAATLLLRAMVRDFVKFSQREYYPRAWGWVEEAASLAVQISDFQGYEDHATFEARLRTGQTSKRLA